MTYDDEPTELCCDLRHRVEDLLKETRQPTPCFNKKPDQTSRATVRRSMRTALIGVIAALLSVGGCGIITPSGPSEKDARKVIEYFIEKNSEGAIKLVTFSKT